MSLTDEQKRALTWLAVETRKTTHGCGTWDQPGTHKAITDVCGSWSFGTALDHVVAHARDPKARTPYAMRGSKPNLEPATTARYPMRAGDPDECRTHRGQHVDHCSGCAADQKTDATNATDERPGCVCGHGWEYHGPEVPGCCECTCGFLTPLEAARAALKTGRQETNR